MRDESKVLWAALLGLALAACGGSGGAGGGGEGGVGGTGGSAGAGGTGGTVAEICGNGADDDGNGKADCDDAACAGEAACRPGEICDNDDDDDGDGAVDCEDGDCAADPACAEICGNGVDDDGDGKADCADPDCAEACVETECDDGVDNDGDGVADCADYDCGGGCGLVECADADLGELFPVHLDGSTAGAGDDAAPSCGEGGEDRAFLWTAPDDGVYLLDTDGSTIDTLLAVHLEPNDPEVTSCGGPEIQCNDDVGFSPASRIALLAFAGERYRIVVDGAQPGHFQLHVTEAPPSEAALCDNGVDDDGDFLVDCDDDDCAGTGACPPAGCVDSALPGDVLPLDWPGSTWFMHDDVQPSCNEGAGNDVGFGWIAPEAGDYVVEAIGDSMVPVLAVYGGEGCDGEEIACRMPTSVTGEDGLARHVASVAFSAEAGQAFTFVVDHTSTLTDGDFHLLVHRAAAAEAGLCGNGLDDDGDNLPDCADDECTDDPACLFPCVDAELGSAVGTSVNGSDFARPSAFEPSCGGSVHGDVVYAWTAPSTGRFVFETAGSTHDTVLHVRTNSCDDGEELACNDDVRTGLASRVFLTATQGETYFVVVDGWADYSFPGGNLWGGDFVLTVDAAPQRETQCTDGDDEDGDGRVDCADTDCVGAAGCTAGGPEICTNGRDDDGDGQADCADTGCAANPACLPGAGADVFLGRAWPLQIADTTAGAGDDLQLVGCGTATGTPDKVFEWIVPTSGTYTFALAANGFTPNLHVLAGGASGWDMGCTNLAAGEAQAEFAAKLRAGMRVAFVVDAYQGATAGAFTLSATRN